MGCHKVEDHHANQLATASPSTACASCHRDHRGRDASLVRLPDGDCTSCHANLKAHARVAQAEFRDVTAFPSGHPEFALFAGKARPVDPGTLKFNHKVHLARGLNPAAGGMPILKVEQLSGAGRERYANGRKLDEGVQLECISCHRLESGSRAPSSSPEGSLAALANPLPGTGAYMRPISYQTDCAECHTLTVPMTQGDGTSTRVVQHRLQPPALHDFLTNASIGITLEKDEKLLEAFTPSKQLRPGFAGPAEQSASKEVEARVSRAEKILFGKGAGTCTECHNYKVAGATRAYPDFDAPLASAAISPTYVPTIWYEHARFDHSSHRAVSCKECHASAWSSATSEDVLIPAKDSCVKCHAPASRDPAGQVQGGAGHSCTECHRYHGADHNSGPSMAKDADALEVSRFLSGKTRPNVNSSSIRATPP